jgi:pimeloyl-ACP methyl ester carboxylesterase
MIEETVRVNGVELCVRTVGDPALPAILLISGAAASMDWWDTDFCARLAAGDRCVIRYDHRDTGRSTTWPAGKPGYPWMALVDDAAALVDRLGHGRAHLVGVSMGGGIAQRLAVEDPGRVATLTLVATSPGYADDLPPMAGELRALFADPPPDPDWTDRAAVIDHLVKAQRAFGGTVDEPAIRAVLTRIVDRTRDIEAASKNHWLAGGDDDEQPFRPRLAGITAPTLVVHGTADPFFPPAHGEALAREIPGAELILLDGVGHEVPPPSTWDTVAPAVRRLTGVSPTGSTSGTGCRPGPRR